ncbi:enoyl-CoA hydratase/isomerase family protein [Pseudooceanicola sp. 200-1SW]|uniref:enoyl-CoA hydratase/isomerase family protein n=1 Tax=Pseudooceanicola sp. 200-1SW TaxID=3425949 RepID=UPI003D7F9D0B
MTELLIEIRDGAATVTFNRPERRNAMSLGLMRKLDAALDDLARDTSVRAVILTGAGDKAFGAGLDIKEAATLSAAEHEEQHALYEGTQQKLASYPKPLIAAIEGVAAGGSLQMALHCDLIVVAEGARIGMPELSAGRPCIMGSFLLARSFGPALAARLVLGQDWIGAAEAEACGLASRRAPQGAALDGARAYAAKLSATAPQALAATLAWLRQLRNGGAHSLGDAIAYADQILPDLATGDEAMAASARFAGGRGDA